MSKSSEEKAPQKGAAEPPPGQGSSDKGSSDKSSSGKNEHKKSHGYGKRLAGVRSFWSGTIAFGLVSVPVDLFPAKRSRGVAMRMLTPEGVPVERRYYCPLDNVEVHSEHILRGYEYEPGEYVIVRDEELDALSPRKSREIDLQQFVDLGDIDPVLFDRPYFLTPAGDSAKAYQLLAQVMEESGKVGIATFVMRNKEYLVAILAEQGMLRAQTLRFENEIRSPADVGLPPPFSPDQKRVQSMVQTINRLSKDELPLDELKDEYGEHLRALAEAKRKAEGTVTVTESAEEPDSEDGETEPPSEDLLETIKRSMQSLQASQDETNGE